MHNRGSKEWDQFGNLSDYGPFAYNGEENVSHSDIEAPLRDDFAAIDGSFGPLFKLDGRKAALEPSDMFFCSEDFSALDGNDFIYGIAENKRAVHYGNFRVL